MNDEERGASTTLREVEQAIEDLLPALDLPSELNRDRRVRNACEEVRAVAGFLRRVADGNVIDKKIVDLLRGDDTFTEAFRPIVTQGRDSGLASRFRGTLTAMGRRGLEDELCAQLITTAELFQDRLREGLVVFRSVVFDLRVADKEAVKLRRDAVAFAEGFESDLISREQERRLREERLAAEESKKELQLVQEKSLDELSGHYQTYSNDQLKIADRLRMSVVALLVLIAAVAGYYFGPVAEPTPTIIATKLSISLPLAILAGYLARESSRHRRAAQWSSDLAIALRTLTPFVNGLTAEDDKQKCIMAMGLRVFATPDQPNPPPDRSLFQDLEDLLGEAKGVLGKVQTAVSELRKE